MSLASDFSKSLLAPSRSFGDVLLVSAIFGVVGVVAAFTQMPLAVGLAISTVVTMAALGGRHFVAIHSGSNPTRKLPGTTVLNLFEYIVPPKDFEGVWQPVIWEGQLDYLMATTQSKAWSVALARTRIYGNILMMAISGFFRSVTRTSDLLADTTIDLHVALISSISDAIRGRVGIESQNKLAEAEKILETAKRTLSVAERALVASKHDLNASEASAKLFEMASKLTEQGLEISFQQLDDGGFAVVFQHPSHSSGSRLSVSRPEGKIRLTPSRN